MIDANRLREEALKHRGNEARRYIELFEAELLKAAKSGATRYETELGFDVSRPHGAFRYNGIDVAVVTNEGMQKAIFSW